MGAHESPNPFIDAENGDADALAKLMPVVYGELRRMARQQLRGERRAHTLQTTALVHEVFLRLVDREQLAWESRGHFFAVAATAMRRILVNHAKSRARLKRGGGRQALTLQEADAVFPDRSLDLLALDEAMTKLGQLDERKATLVELRFFGGLTVEETADVLDVSPRTVKRDWRLAKVWLLREISAGEQV